jgi:hypothetical protein
MTNKRLIEGIKLEKQIRILQDKFNAINVIGRTERIDIHYSQKVWDGEREYGAWLLEIDLVNFELIEVINHIKNIYKDKLDKLKKEFSEL